MNNPDTVPINVDDEVSWILAYKAQHGLSWAALERETGIPRGTISQLGNGNYAGNMDAQARRIFKFRQKVESQEQRSRSALALPEFIPTPSAKRLLFLLEVAQMGRITVAATGPGIGKTMVAREYQASMANCWLLTMRKSTSSLSAMLAGIMKVMGLQSQSGWTRQRSEQIAAHVRDRKGALLIVDEANHATLDCLEELRGLHDETGLGIALFGNEELLMRIRSSDKRHAYARLNSRIANSHIQDVPRQGDVDAFLDAFGIDDGKARELLSAVALSPHHGGLREVKQILESANMLAIDDDTAIALSHIEEAQRSRLTQHMRRAA